MTDNRVVTNASFHDNRLIDIPHISSPCCVFTRCGKGADGDGMSLSYLYLRVVISLCLFIYRSRSIVVPQRCGINPYLCHFW